MDELKMFEMPPSWVNKIDISPQGQVLTLTLSHISFHLLSLEIIVYVPFFFFFIFIDMEMRYPGGMKVIQYRKAKLEKFAPYLLKDGLVTKLTIYKDLDCKIFADVFVFNIKTNKQSISSHIDHVHLY